jgi:DNA-binding FadR family transcriptional regulator
MFPEHYLEVIKRSGLSFAEVARQLNWSQSRFQSMRTNSTAYTMDAKEYKEMSAWVDAQEHRDLVGAIKSVDAYQADSIIWDQDKAALQAFRRWCEGQLSYETVGE